MPEKFGPDAALVRKLAKLLEETGLGEIEYAEGDKKIRCAMPSTVAPAAFHHPAVPMPAPTSAATAAVEKASLPNGIPVTSPMVGTVYLASSPNAPPFVKVGDKVKAGDTLLIIEAMKVMNPIKAPSAGTIAEILAADGKPVEFGEVLLVIE